MNEKEHLEDSPQPESEQLENVSMQTVWGQGIVYQAIQVLSALGAMTESKRLAGIALGLRGLSKGNLPAIQDCEHLKAILPESDSIIITTQAGGSDEKPQNRYRHPALCMSCHEKQSEGLILPHRYLIVDNSLGKVELYLNRGGFVFSVSRILSTQTPSVEDALTLLDGLQTEDDLKNFVKLIMATPPKTDDEGTNGQLLN